MSVLKIGTKNTDGLATPLVSEDDGVLKTINVGPYTYRRAIRSEGYLEKKKAGLKRKYIDSEFPLLSKIEASNWNTAANFHWDNTKDAMYVKTTYNNQYYSRQYSPAFDFSAIDHFRINVEIVDYENHNQLFVRFFTTTNDYYDFYILQDSLAQFGRGEITFDKASCTATGSPSWSNISEIRFYVGKKQSASYVEAYIYDFSAIKKKPKNAKILFRIDDGLLSVYEKAMPVFRKYNIPATCFVNPGYVLSGEHASHASYGGNPAMSIEELTTLHDMGWSICCHTWYHNLYRDPISPVSQTRLRYKYSQAYFDLSATQDWLYAKGFGDGALCSVYGNHAYNEETYAAEKDLMLLGFSRHSNQTMFDTMPWGEGLRHMASHDFFRHEIIDGEEIFPEVDNLINHGGLLVVMCHRFDDIDDIEPNRPELVTDQGSISSTTLDKCLAYVCSKPEVDCITASDLVYATPIALR